METENIYQYKSYLFTISYNLTGNAQLAEDLVQDTFEKWLSADRSEVKSAKAYLSKIIVNKSIDALEKQKKERVLYKGLWLPEPLIAEGPEASSEEVLDYAFLFFMEKLNPYERAVVVLREVLEYSYNDISGFLELSADNCRQILHRAKEKMKSPRKTSRQDEVRQKELLQAFLQAVYENDTQKLEHLLKEDITLYSDGGGKAAAALKPLTGFAKVVKFLIGITNLQKEENFTWKEVYINGGPAIILFTDQGFHSLIWVEISEDKIQNLFTIRNPDKVRI